MNITFLTPTLEMHGGNIVMLKYADYLIDQGHIVSIITTNKPVQFELNPKIKVIFYKKFPIRLVDFFTFQLVYLKKVKRVFKELSLETDMLIPIYAPLIIHAISLKKRLKKDIQIVPLFQDSFHTLWVGPYIRKIVRSKYVQSEIVNPIAISRPLADQYEKLTGRGPYLIVNGIEHEHFYPTSVKKEGYVLFVGRLNPAKGYPDFLKAVQLLKSEGQELKVVIVNPQGVDKHENGIQFVSYQNREQLADAYRKAFVYVNTSRAESFALPPLEAMASGTATVITDTGGQREYAQDRENASIVPIGDTQKIADAVRELLENEELRHSYEEAGVKTASLYSWDTSCKRFEGYLLDHLKDSH